MGIGMKRMFRGLTAAGMLTVTPVLADDFKLAWPVDCVLGKDCFIQNYVDVDPGPGVEDYACGSASYDKHTGTDIRVLSEDAARAGVAVKAAAKGIVRGTRDGEPDHRISTEADIKALSGKECGNGVVVVHEGYETQYCHMLKGSVAVNRGDIVEAGSVLGKVGFSGEAAFAHLHFEVRQGATPLDPFLGLPQKGECRADLGKADAPAGGLWASDLVKAIPYLGTEIIETGFADAPLDNAILEAGTSAIRRPAPESNALLFFMRVINARQGDTMRLLVRGPRGFAVESAVKPLDHSKATYVAFSGKKRILPVWPAGHYAGTAEVLRNGVVIATAAAALELTGSGLPDSP